MFTSKANSKQKCEKKMQERKTGDVVQDPARLSVQVVALACDNVETWESARLEVA